MSDNAAEGRRKGMAMKHRDAVIEFSEMVWRIKADTNTPWPEVVGYPSQRADAAYEAASLGHISKKEAHQIATLEEEEAEARLAGQWWLVRWSDDCPARDFDASASYRRFFSAADAYEASKYQAELIPGDPGCQCRYCLHDHPLAIDHIVPDVDDDEAWGKLAPMHSRECEWILTRAHRVSAST